MTTPILTPPNSALARPLDPIRFFTNRLILILTPAAGLVIGGVTLLSRGDLGAAVAAGFWTGAAVLQTWIMARELDPEHDYSAFVGVALVFSVMLLAGAPAFDLLPTMVLVTLARVVNRIVGPPAALGEAVAMLVAAGLMLLMGYLPIVAVIALGLFLDASLLPQPERRQLIFAGLVGGLLLAAPLLNRAVIPGVLEAPAAVMLGIIAFAFSIIIFLTRSTSAQCDLPNYTAMPIRIQTAMLLTLLAVGALAMLGGTPAALLLLPTWAAMAGIPLFRLMSILWLMSIFRR